MGKKPKPAAPKWKDGEGGWERLEDPEALRELAEQYGGVVTKICNAAGLAGGGHQTRKLRQLAADAEVELKRGVPGPKATPRAQPAELGAPEASVDTEALDAAVQRNRILEQQVDHLQRRTRARVCEWSGDVLKLGVLGDTHCGSLYENPQLVEAAYDAFVQEQVDEVLHCGDVTDGEKMHKGHEYEISVHGFNAQRDHVVATYPRREGLRTRFITGNHDGSFWRRAGANIGEAIAERRDDMEYLGMDQYDLEYRGVIIRMQHPGGGTSPYGVSYKPQRIIELMPGGQKPHMLLLGHFHKAEVIPFYRNVYSLQVGTTQSQTPWMASKPILAMMGFWILTIHINDQGLGRIQDEWFPHFEEAA